MIRNPDAGVEVVGVCSEVAPLIVNALSVTEQVPAAAPPASVGTMKVIVLLETVPANVVVGVQLAPPLSVTVAVTVPLAVTPVGKVKTTVKFPAVTVAAVDAVVVYLIIAPAGIWIVPPPADPATACVA
jgi:hypothetical protein